MEGIKMSMSLGKIMPKVGDRIPSKKDSPLEFTIKLLIGVADAFSALEKIGGLGKSAGGTVNKVVNLFKKNPENRSVVSTH
jgi:hypothetical protein